MANGVYVSEIKGDISQDPNVVEIPEIIVHGNPPRAWQCGWGCNYAGYNESGYPASDTTHNRSGYAQPDYVFPVNGIQDSNPNDPSSITNQIRTAYASQGVEITPSGGHAGGNPALVMYLKMKDFKQRPGGMLSFEIEEAYIRAFPGPLPLNGVSGGRRGTSADSIYGRTTPEYNLPPIWWDRDGSGDPFNSTGINNNLSQWHAVCDNELSQIQRWNAAGVGIREPAIDSAGILLTMYYDFIIDSKIVSSGELLTKPDPGQGIHSERGYDNVIYWTEEFGREHYSVKNKKIYGPGPGSGSVLFTLRVDSQCKCDQTNKSRPIIALDLTKKFNREPYVWRRFGRNADEDPEGNRIDSSKLDGKWHLVSPLWTMIKPKNKQQWQNVEKDPEDDLYT